jgi:hypothetical protein
LKGIDHRLAARPVALVAALHLGACVAVPPRVPDLSTSVLLDEHRQAIDVQRLIARASFTVLVFFSPDCRYLDAHEGRLRALFDADQPRGIQFVMIDSEVRGSPERDAEAARGHGYPFPILTDDHGRLAQALGAEFAGYVVVLDPGGQVHYRGGVDSDRTHLHDDADLYLKDALDALLDHRAPPVAEGKTLGCALQRW